MGDTKDRVIAQILSMSVKLNSHNNNELRLLKEVVIMCSKSL